MNPMIPEDETINVLADQIRAGLQLGNDVQSATEFLEITGKADTRFLKSDRFYGLAVQLVDRLETLEKEDPDFGPLKRVLQQWAATAERTQNFLSSDHKRQKPGPPLP